MLIGTDINISVCKAEGYLMMEYKVKELIKKGILQKDVAAHFTATSGPLTHDDNGRLLPESKRKTDILITDAWLSWNDIYELFKTNEKTISDFADYEHCKPDFENPTAYGLLNFASDVYGYQGLN